MPRPSKAKSELTVPSKRKLLAIEESLVPELTKKPKKDNTAKSESVALNLWNDWVTLRTAGSPPLETPAFIDTSPDQKLALVPLFLNQITKKNGNVFKSDTLKISNFKELIKKQENDWSGAIVSVNGNATKHAWNATA
jgi:hypothetical protein